MGLLGLPNCAEYLLTGSVGFDASAEEINSMTALNGAAIDWLNGRLAPGTYLALIEWGGLNPEKWIENAENCLPI